LHACICRGLHWSGPAFVWACICLGLHLPEKEKYPHDQEETEILKNQLQCLARKTLRLILREHKKGNYIYSLDQTLIRDEKLFAEAKIATTSEIKILKKCFGEAQIEMLYESSDAAVRGIAIPDDAKHRLFIAHLQNNMEKEGLIQKSAATTGSVFKRKSYS
jgi:hypothetical protein